MGFFFQAEDGIRDLVRSRGLGDVYKRQAINIEVNKMPGAFVLGGVASHIGVHGVVGEPVNICLLYTSDAADERSSVDLGGRRIIKKKTHIGTYSASIHKQYQIQVCLLTTKEQH